MLQSNRVLLRPWENSDAEALILQANNPKVARNLQDGFPNPYTPADAERYLAGVAEQSPVKSFAIVVDGIIAGGIGLEPRDNVYRYSSHFGYWLGESFWGQGIATEALRLLMPYAFTYGAITRLETSVYAWNPASCRVLEKCGFKHEGTRRRAVCKNADFTDLHLYGLLKEEYEATPRRVSHPETGELARRYFRRVEFAREKLGDPHMATALLLVMAAMAAATPIPVILDTDLGDDIDDTWALCYLLGSPEIELKLIVTAADDTPAKTRLVAKMLQETGRTDIPLGTGKKTSDEPIHQATWLGPYDIATYTGKIHEDGVQALIDAIHASATPVTLCVIGPQTNIAEALKRDPSIASKARVVCMAGSVRVGYMGADGAAVEWNVKKDIAAIRAVFAAPWEVVMAPLDICGMFALFGERFLGVAHSTAPRAKMLIENYEMWSNRAGYPPAASSILFDTVAAWLCHAEDLAEMETIKLSVNDEGKTKVDETAGRPVRCAMKWKDRAAFEQLLVDRITKDPAK